MEKLLKVLKDAEMDNSKLIGLAVRRFASDLLNDSEELEILKDKGFCLDEEKLEKLIEQLDELSWE